MATTRTKTLAPRGKTKPVSKAAAKPAAARPVAGQSLAAVFRGPTASLAKLAAALPAKIEAVRDDLEQTAARMAALKKAGVIYATEHWRKTDGEPKYLYLVHPMKNGERPSPDYIGCDPEKIAEARAGIARAREYEELARHEKDVSRAISDATSDLQRAIYHFDYR